MIVRCLHAHSCSRNSLTFLKPTRFIWLFIKKSGRDSSVGIVTRYGLDGPGIEPRLGARFSTPVQTGPGTHPVSYTMRTGSFPGVNWPGRGVGHPHPSSAKVKERIELYIYSTSGPSWPHIWRTLPLTYS